MNNNNNIDKINEKYKFTTRIEEYKKLDKYFGEGNAVSLPIVVLEKIVALENIGINIDAHDEKMRNEILYASDFTNSYLVVAFGNKKGEFFEYASVCRIERIKEVGPKNIKATIVGIVPAQIKSVEKPFGDNIEMAKTVFRKYSTEMPTDREKTELKDLKSLFQNFLQYLGKTNVAIYNRLNECYDPNEYVNLILPLVVDVTSKQIEYFLQETNASKRMAKISEIIEMELDKKSIVDMVNHKVQANLDKNQKEMILREQLRVINDELDGEVDDMEKMKEKLLAKKMPKNIEDYSIKELNRLKKMPFGSPEIGYIRNFLDTILELPFNETTDDKADLENAKEILDSNHYGLEEVKERILEFLAVLQKTKKLSGQILCFVGPPGIGKTSIVKSIASALGRNFAQMSLGGISDESLIRGHSRTYVGARAGRIIMGMKNAKTANPVFLLDEVDKLTRDARGDPASALLEVLDPEQNAHFKDNFLEIEYDLSQVLFVATANDKSTIPAPLLDRMEVVELNTYTDKEKVEIAKRHLIPRQLVRNGIESDNLLFTDEAIVGIITNYTLESGVRNLERKIAQICRKVVVKTEKQPNAKYVVNESDLQEYLGAELIPFLHIYQGGNVGEAVGLAWTQVGGTALLIEVALCEGNGKLKFTGKLGEVFKESVELAMSVVKSRAKKYGIDPSMFKKTDVHIHLPEMAVGKEGPSAGITLTTALISAFTKRATKPKFVMTGEISLLGRVLPIGGLKEKMLAGIKVGATDLVIPETNRSDYEKNKKLVEGKLNVHFVSNIDEVIDLILEPSNNESSQPQKSSSRKKTSTK